jgi:hypothetical protein
MEMKLNLILAEADLDEIGAPQEVKIKVRRNSVHAMAPTYPSRPSLSREMSPTRQDPRNNPIALRAVEYASQPKSPSESANGSAIAAMNSARTITHMMGVIGRVIGAVIATTRVATIVIKTKQAA